MSYMKKSKWILFMMVLVLLVGLYFFQYKRVNANIPDQKIENYQKNQSITLPNLKYEVHGYSLEKQIKGYSDPNIQQDVVYLLVNLTIENKSASSLRVPIAQYKIRTDLYSNAADLMVFNKLNNSSEIKPNETKNIIVPFTISDKIDISKLRFIVATKDNVRVEVKL